jgi:hypothetical protein
MGTLGSTQSQEATADASGQASDVAFDNARSAKLRSNSRIGNQSRVREIQFAPGHLATTGARLRTTQKNLCKTSRDSWPASAGNSRMAETVSGLADRQRNGRVFVLRPRIYGAASGWLPRMVAPALG